MKVTFRTIIPTVRGNFLRGLPSIEAFGWITTRETEYFAKRSIFGIKVKCLGWKKEW